MEHVYINQLAPHVWKLRDKGAARCEIEMPSGVWLFWRTAAERLKPGHSYTMRGMVGETNGPAGASRTTWREIHRLSVSVEDREPVNKIERGRGGTKGRSMG